MKRKVQKSSKNIVREAFGKGKDYLKSKVNSCKEILRRSSMKETKKRSHGPEVDFGGSISGGETISPNVNGHSSFQNDTNGHQISSDLNKTTAMSSDEIEDVENNLNQAVAWSVQKGHDQLHNTDYMVLPEMFTTYDDVSEGRKLQKDLDEKISSKNGKDTMNDKLDKENDDDHHVEILIVDEETTDLENNLKEKRELTEDQRYLEEAIPLGSEAQSFEKSSRLETSQLEVPVDKRLKWLLGNLDQNSFGSDFSQNTGTSNSSDISLDMLLQERTDDPEEILTSLGFGVVERADNPIERIPERFIVDRSGADGFSMTDVFSDNPELSHLLQAISDQQEGPQNFNQANLDAMMSGHGNPHYGNMLNSVMHGMKFLNLLSSAKSLSNLSEKPEEHPSVLQNPKNREYLAKQGFYDRYTKKKQTESRPNKLVKSQSLDASEKRKRFQATKSRNYSSLTNVPEQDEVFDSHKVNSGNYYSFGSMRASSVDTYHRSMTSIETSTDSFDSSDSPGYRGRQSSTRPDPYFGMDQCNNVDSGVWNTEDSQKSLDEEYLAECVRDSAKQRKSQVSRMMTADNYEVGDDIDILKSPALSRTGSLESTLTASGFHTYKTNESFDDEDVEMYSEAYLADDRARKQQHDSRHKKSTENIQREVSDRLCLLQPESVSRLESVSGWNKFHKRYGVEMCVKVPGNKTEADVVTNNYEISRNTEIPLESQSEKQTELDRPGLGSIGKIESIQSDSSGFAEAEPVMPEPQLIQKVSSLGSSTESDQTFKSSITILPNKSDTPKMSITSPDGTQSISLDVSGSEVIDGNIIGSKIDVAVGTDDFSEYLHAPTISYHLHEREREDSGTCSDGDKSVILTIELPRNWVNTNPNKKQGKPRVVSHLYKEIGPRSLSVELDGVSGVGAFSAFQPRHLSNNPLLRTSSDGSVPLDYPERSSTPFTHYQGNLRNAPNKSETSKRTLFSNQFQPPSSSPTSLSVFSDFAPVHNRIYPDMHSDSELNMSNASLISKTDSVSDLCNNSLEYYKLMKLVNQPVSFKTDSLGQKSLARYVPKINIKQWTQLKKTQQLEEETKLVQHTLQRYKTELNMMESHFLVKLQLAKDDLSYGDREDVQELQFLFAEIQKEVLMMEQTLANRLGGINMGNDNYNPLLAMDIVRKMTELLREQIYQQQMSNEKEDDAIETAQSDIWRSGGSKQLLDVRQKSSASDGDSEISISNSLSELKESILSEVRQELHDNTQWLHRELQKKERELNALKLEMMASSIKAGTTRKKHFFESDV